MDTLFILGNINDVDLLNGEFTYNNLQFDYLLMTTVALALTYKLHSSVTKIHHLIPSWYYNYYGANWAYQYTYTQCSV